MIDGANKLCQALWDRDSRPADRVGGMDAPVLHCAAKQITAQQEARERLERENAELRATLETIAGCLCVRYASGGCRRVGGALCIVCIAGEAVAK